MPAVIASVAKQSSADSQPHHMPTACYGLLRFARNDGRERSSPPAKLYPKIPGRLSPFSRAQSIALS